MAGTGDQAVKALSVALHPVRGPEAKTVAALIAKLEDDEADVRRAAQAELRAMGPSVEKAVRQALNKAIGPESSCAWGWCCAGCVPPL